MDILRQINRQKLLISSLVGVSSLLCPNLSLAKGHPDYSKAGEAAYAKGNLVEAERNLSSALKEAEHSDPNGLKVAEALNGLGVIYDETHRYAEAESAYKRSLAIREKAYGPSHMAVATTLSNLANLYKDQKKYNEAEPLYKRSIDICLEKEGSNSEFFAVYYYNLAILHMLQNRSEDAVPLLKRSMQLCENSSRFEERLSDSIGTLGMAYHKLGKLSDAKPLFLRYFEMKAKDLRLNPNDPKTVQVLRDYAQFERKLDSTHVAELTEKAIEYRIKPPQ